MLCYFHTVKGYETDFVQLKQMADTIELLTANLRWIEYSRYSSRQRKKMKIGGILGRIDITGSTLKWLWPFMWLGHLVNTGKTTSMGNGRYAIDINPPS